MQADHTRSAADLVERLYEAADAVEDGDVRDEELYKTIAAALEVWAPECLKRVQAGELAAT